MNRALLCLATLYLATPLHAQTLAQAIATAYESNPRLAAARARQDALAETPRQARAAARPTATLEGAVGYDKLDYGREGSLTAQAALPLWTGGRVSSAVRAADGDVAAGAQGLRDTEAQILQEVVRTYTALLYNQQAVDVARVGIERLDRQVEETRSRFTLGQATRTDVAQLEAQRATVVANLADAQGSLATAAADYRAVVGQDAGTLSAEVPASTALPATDAEARTAALEANPQLLQQRRVHDAAAARINQQRAEAAPRLDLQGAYGRGEQLSDGHLGGYAAAASVGVTLKVPLLTGGLVSSRIRQAEATSRAEAFQIVALEREVVRATDAAWASLTAARVRLNASLAGLTAADLGLRGVRAEYGFGLRSTVDILLADQSLRLAQLAVAQARADVVVAQATLLRAVGRLGPNAYRTQVEHRSQ